MIEIKILDSFDNIKKETWNGLVNSCSHKYIFQTYEFQSIWWKNFGEKNKNRDLLLLTAQENGSIIGIAPLMFEKVKILNKPIIKFVGTPICDYFDFIIVKNHIKVISLFYKYLKNQKCLEIDLLYLPEEANALKTNYTQTLLVDACPFIELEENWQNVYSELNKSIKKYVKRRENSIAKVGDLKFYLVKEENEIDSFLDKYFSMHINRWKDHKKQYSQFQYKYWKDFVRELCHSLFPLGFISLSYLKLNSDLIASHFGFIYNKTFYWYMPAYNPEYGKYSPGHLLTMALLKYSSTEELNRFDFLRGTEPHKAFWTNKTSPLFNFIGYSDYKYLEKTGRTLRGSKEFYLKHIKVRLKKISPVMKLWYKTRGN